MSGIRQTVKFKVVILILVFTVVNFYLNSSKFIYVYFQCAIFFFLDCHCAIFSCYFHHAVLPVPFYHAPPYQLQDYNYFTV